MEKAHKQPNINKLIFFAVGVLALCLLFVPAVLSGQTMERFGTHEVSHLTGFWYRHGQAQQEVTLPATLPSQPAEEVVFLTLLPKQLPKAAHICMRSSLSRVRISLEDKLLYDSGIEGSGGMIGSRWNLVSLPDLAAGKTLQISLVSNHAGRAGALNDVMLGSQNSILFYIIARYSSGLIVGSLTLLLGLLLLPLHFLMDKKLFSRQDTIYLSLFAIATGGWLIGESKMLQFFTTNLTFTTLLPFLSLLVAPIPLALYIEGVTQLPNKRLPRILFWAFIGNFLLCCTLHFTGIADFYTTLPLTHLLILVFIVSVTASMLREAICHHNKRAIYLLFAQSVLFASALAELVMFYLGEYAVTGIGLQLGLLCYVVLLGGYSYHEVGTLLKKNQETRYLRSLAYRDLLTGGKNRTAYYEDIPQYFNASTKTFSWLLLFDLNNLKQINDSYGHAAGDEALRNTFACIEQCFAQYGSCYRIGGDEFAAFLEGLSEQEIEQAIACFEEAVQQTNMQLPYDFKVALGFGWYDSMIYENFESLSHEVDRRMYANKVKQKITNATGPLEKVKTMPYAPLHPNRP